MPTLDQLLGPLGLTAGALALIIYVGRLVVNWVLGLWKEHLAADERDRNRLTRTEERLDTTLDLLKEVADVTERSVAVGEEAITELRERAKARDR